MARLAYVLLSYLLTPLVVAFLLWRALRSPAYLDRFPERFGFGDLRFECGCIWVHAVSVGEVQAAVPLINSLREHYPDTPLLVTTVTPTGAQRVREIFGGQVTHCYAPYDLVGAVRRFFDRAQPRIAIIIETELWPNLYHECGRRRVPLVLASARVSPRSVHRYRQFVTLFREALSHGIVIAAQSEEDAERFRSLGANPARTHTIGNIKFDFEMPAEVLAQGRELRQLHAAGRPVLVAASTHANEEEIILDAFASIRAESPDCLLVMVPRHPERFSGVGQLLSDRGIPYATRTSGITCEPDAQVYLVDTLGELILFYAAADLAFVGGSLVPVGGHNLLEPAALGLPILTGPHVFNAEDIARKLIDCGAAISVADAGELARQTLRLLADDGLRASAGSAGARVVRDNRGAVARLLALIEPLVI